LIGRQSGMFRQGYGSAPLPSVAEGQPVPTTVRGRGGVRGGRGGSRGRGPAFGPTFAVQPAAPSQHGGQPDSSSSGSSQELKDKNTYVTNIAPPAQQGEDLTESSNSRSSSANTDRSSSIHASKSSKSGDASSDSWAEKAYGKLAQEEVQVLDWLVLDADGKLDDANDALTPDQKWSTGTALHASGQCKPCLYLNTRDGCFNGAKCNFCHAEHKRNRPRPSKATRTRCKQILAMANLALESGSPEEVDAMRSLAKQSPYMRSLLRGKMQQHAVSSGMAATSMRGAPGSSSDPAPSLSGGRPGSSSDPALAGCGGGGCGGGGGGSSSGGCGSGSRSANAVSL